MTQPPVVLLTGSPGVGKTTVIERFLTVLRDRLSTRCLEVREFVTRELRGAGGQRVGFEAVLCGSDRAVLLAHESAIAPPPGRRLPQVSKYVVDVPGFEAAVLPELQLPTTDDKNTLRVVVIDEIGKMECFSSAFKRRVTALLDGLPASTSVVVIGTIVIKSQDQFIEGIKARADVRLLEVTRQNRDAVPNQMLTLLGL